MSESEGGLFELAAVRARVAAEAAEDPEAARLLYTEEIFAWTDAFSEEEPGGEEGEGEGKGGQRRARLQAIGRLWTRYAAMEQQLKQWKKAVQVFEDALQDEVANRCLELYLAYVSFYRARGKISSAQKVLVRALAAAGPLHCPPQPPVRVYLPATAGAVSNDVKGVDAGGMCELTTVDILWIQFLLMMRSAGSGGGGSPELKLEQLHSMLTTQMGSSSPLASPSSFELVEAIVERLASMEEGGPGGKDFDRLVEAVVLGKSEAEKQPNEELHEESPSKRPRLDESSAPTSSITPLPHSMDVDVSEKPERRSRFSSGVTDEREQTQVRSASGDTAVLSIPVPSLVDLEDISGLGSGSTTSEKLLTALLDGYKDRPTLLFSAPNKEPLLSGFRGLDAAMIGDIEKYFANSGISPGHSSGESLAQELQSASRDPHSQLTRTLDVLEGLWTCQGLKEGHFDAWFGQLMGSHREEEEALRRHNYEEEARLRASKASSTNLNILRSKHENALRTRRIYASLQTDMLNANVNRTLCVLRKEQEEVLRLINFPYSAEIDSDLLYNFFNTKKGQPAKEKDEKATLQYDTECSKFDNMHNCLLKQRMIIGALLTLCTALSPERGPLASPTVAAPPHVAVPLLERGASSFSVSSAGSRTSPRSPDNTSVGSGGERGSSVKKKRRRKLVDSQEQETLLRRRSGSGSGYSSGGGIDMYDSFGAIVAPTSEISADANQVAASRRHESVTRTSQSNQNMNNPGAHASPQQHQSHPPQQYVKQPTSAPVFTTTPLLPLTALSRGPSTSTNLSASTSTPAAPGSTKAANLAKIAALLASKKANKK